MQLKTPPERIPLLVVDDDQEIRSALGEALEDAGYTVHSARHGADALAVLRSIPPPAAILLDLFMPEMNGWRFVDQLKHLPDLAHIPIVVITAVGPYWGPPAPPERVLRKPFQTEQLLKLLDEVIRPT